MMKRFHRSIIMGWLSPQQSLQRIVEGWLSTMQILTLHRFFAEDMCMIYIGCRKDIEYSANPMS